MNQNDQPEEFKLEQNSPNPFNKKTTIGISVPKPGVVKLLIYNRKKEILQVLHDGPLAAGAHEFSWNADVKNGTIAADGNYYYSLEADGFVAIRKLSLKSQ